MAECCRVHWRHLAIWLNLCLLQPTWVHIPNGKSIDSAVSLQLTAESLYFTVGDPFPHNCPFHGGSGPHLIHDSLGQSEPTIQTASRLVRCFCTGDRGVSLYFTMSTPFPKIAPSHGGYARHLIHDPLGPPESSVQTASQSVQLFLHRWLQSVPIVYNGTPLFPGQNCPFPWGTWTPI